MSHSDEIASNWTTVSNVRMHYLVAGPEHGQPLVLLHGTSFSTTTWREIGTLEALAECGPSL